FTYALHATTATLSLHDALPILRPRDAVYRCTEQPIDAGIQERPGTLIGIEQSPKSDAGIRPVRKTNGLAERDLERVADACRTVVDRKSTRLNSSHVKISYAVFC